MLEQTFLPPYWSLRFWSLWHLLTRRQQHRKWSKRRPSLTFLWVPQTRQTISSCSSYRKADLRRAASQKWHWCFFSSVLLAAIKLSPTLILAFAAVCLFFPFPLSHFQNFFLIFLFVLLLLGIHHSVWRWFSWFFFLSIFVDQVFFVCFFCFFYFRLTDFAFQFSASLPLPMLLYISYAA